MSLRRIVPILSLAFLCSTVTARAGTILLKYSGQNEDNYYINAIGSGSFSYNGSLTTLTLADLTGFQFNQTTPLSDPGLMGSDTYSYGLGDLKSFSATISATGVVTALRLQTGYVNSATNFLAPTYMVVSSLGRNGTTFDQGGQDGDLTTGTITASAVPEPSSLAMLGLAGMVGTLAWRRKRAG